MYILHNAQLNKMCCDLTYIRGPKQWDLIQYKNVLNQSLILTFLTLNKLFEKEILNISK